MKCPNQFKASFLFKGQHSFKLHTKEILIKLVRIQSEHMKVPGETESCRNENTNAPLETSTLLANS